MKLTRILVLGASLAICSLSGVRDADACGGCFVPITESTQVTGHRMILSLSQTKTTLWDQITYSGSPESFAWVLPIKGLAEVGVSSDALFGELEWRTGVTIEAPPYPCPVDNSSSSNGSSSGSGGGEEEEGGEVETPGVTVVSQKVVGPYETVQLSATDPGALEQWLDDHGYEIPPSVVGVLDDYIDDGFGFLALKLVPGKDVRAMRPVRVTTPGASTALPLRMIAAGTGAVTPILLWVLGEGRYEPTNFPSFKIDPSKLVWNWATSSSNYSQLVKEGFGAKGGRSWLMEASGWEAKHPIKNSLSSKVKYQPLDSGYGDDMGTGAEEELAGDLDALFGSISGTQVLLTRMRAELPRSSLDADLSLGASADQGWIPRYIVLTQSIGAPCQGGSGGSANDGGSCSTASPTANASAWALSGLAITVAAAFERRRRSRRSAKSA